MAWKLLGALFLSSLLVSIPSAAKASGQWTCNIGVKALSASIVVIVEEEKNIDGPCPDYKKGQAYDLTPAFLKTGESYKFQIVVLEHGTQGAESNEPRWFMVHTGQDGSK